MTGIGWTVVLIALGLTIWGCRSWGQQEPPNNINTNTTSNNNNTNINNNNNSNSNNNNDIELPSIVNDPNKPIYATAVAVPTRDSYDAGIVRYK
eukprot:CAMPEP_0170980706 /NCGR_PEP_ID=MMETSP0736-20130129/2604_1 /TAXON_ID=186038 /ORGANISM="Fragilariopsis kerguelensis, Strain L26-C5" /LENGTH=93 /DNA_ID=CAMNT_0011403617 /DNA_START=200 /DNA_END=478 /DNA_ORIENTATION=-